MDAKGQMQQMATVGIMIGMIVTLMVGIIIINSVFIGATPAVSETIRTTDQTLNPYFTDNTGLNANHWDNYTENGATASLDTTNHWFVMQTTENEKTKIDNGVLKQALAFSTTYDMLVSATTTFSYRVYDNDNAKSIRVRALLDNGTDNIVLYSENVTLNKSTSWTTVENDVSAYITANDTYTIWFRAEMLGYAPDAGGVATLCNVQFDNASLTITTSNTDISAGVAGPYSNLQTYAWIAIGLMAIGIVVLGAVTILSFIRPMMGKGGM